jgi:integrase
MLRTERDTPVRPEHASRTFRIFAHDVGIQAHPHLLRHSLASAPAAATEPASVIAGQLRHAAAARAGQVGTEAAGPPRPT